MGDRGLTKQRNRAIGALAGEADIVTFLDDDAMLSHDYLEAAQSFLKTHPEVVLFSGRVVIDGAIEGELSRASAQRALAQSVPDGHFADIDPLTGAT